MALIVVIGIAGALAAAGNPVHRVQNAWHEFKQVGAPDPSAPGHLSAGFGGARYDYYRVALDVWKEHPVEGIGAGNFAEDYIQRGRVGERPTSPHSIEFGTLVETGLFGAALLALALGAGLFAAGSAARRSGRFSRAVAAGGMLMCAVLVRAGVRGLAVGVPGAGRRGVRLPGAGRRGGAAKAGLPRAAADAHRRDGAGRRGGRGRAAVAARGRGFRTSDCAAPPRAGRSTRTRRFASSTRPRATTSSASDRGCSRVRSRSSSARYQRATTAFNQVLDRDARNLTATISLAGLWNRTRDIASGRSPC